MSGWPGHYFLRIRGQVLGLHSKAESILCTNIHLYLHPSFTVRWVYVFIELCSTINHTTLTMSARRNLYFLLPVSYLIPILKTPPYLILQPLEQSLLSFFVAFGGSQDSKIFMISNPKDQCVSREHLSFCIPLPFPTLNGIWEFIDYRYYPTTTVGYRMDKYSPNPKSPVWGGFWILGAFFKDKCP